MLAAAKHGNYFNRKPAKRRKKRTATISDGYLQRGGGLAALRENPPPAAGCSVCGAVWRTIFSRLAAKEDFTVGLGYRPATIADLKFSKLKVIGHGRNSSRSELRGEVFSRRGANLGLEISSSGAICVHLILCKIAVAIANPSGDRMVKLLRFHGSRTELEGITMDFKTFIDDLSAGYRKLTGQTSSSSFASPGTVADVDAASAAHETRLQAGRGGSGNLNNLDEWKFCLNAA